MTLVKNDKNPKFKTGGTVRISKYKNIFEGYTPNLSDEAFEIKKVKNIVLRTYLLMILTEKKFFEPFTEKNCKMQIKKNLELKKYSREKVINYMLSGKDAIIRLIAR